MLPCSLLRLFLENLPYSLKYTYFTIKKVRLKEFIYVTML